ARERQTWLAVDRLDERFGAAPEGPWSDPPDVAVVLPIPSNIPHQPVGILVAGVSARLKLDEFYRGFLELVTTQVSTAIANARAYEEEKRRAEALAELDRAKTAFFSNVSHEFRTPLTLLLGPTEDLLTSRGALPPQAREQLIVVHRNALRLQKLVNTLLDFSRIEAGRIEACYQPTDLTAVTADLASVFRSAIERAGLRLIVDLPPLAHPVYVDGEMWEKIVSNLLSNAFKFTFEGEIEVELRPAGDAVALSIRDTGMGIPEHELPHVFERFHRVQQTRGRTHEGSGIGLSLVQELVKLHGGSVSVESVEGGGSTFNVSIPIGSAHLPKERIGSGRTLDSTMLKAPVFVEEALRWLPDEGQFLPDG
ncbi:MAG: GAF domain-containing sensor histidine kinase, partial [Vicinamibacteria bacterium]